MTQIAQNRRLFLSMLSSAACASLIGGSNVGAQDEGLETTTIRIGKISGICIAPQYIADALLRAEGFTDIRYVQADAGAPAARTLVRGDTDLTSNFSPTLIAH
jgi:NitT/TauT family transport system substrate-binding protein